MRSVPAEIKEDWVPSTGLYSWARGMNIPVKTLDEERFGFILWHQEKSIKRKNFNLAFRNWLKKALDIKASEIRPQSFKDYVPEKIKVSSKKTGREALDKLRGNKRG